MARKGRFLLPIAALICSSLMACPTAFAQTVDELTAKLEAQEQINTLLKQRISRLEAELQARDAPAAQVNNAAVPVRETGDPEDSDAIERGLVRRGAAVLPAGTIEFTPSLFWNHTGGAQASPTDNLGGFGVDGRVGLKGGWMLGGGALILHRSIAGRGNNTGVGDVSATVWKSVLTETAGFPSLVASVRYTAPTGGNILSDIVPLGSGHHSLRGQLTAVKTIAPIAFFGDVSYTKYVGDTVDGFDFDRGGVIGVGAGGSLAVTPEISVSTGLSFDFAGELSIDGFVIPGSRETRGSLEIGVGTIIGRGLFLNFGGAFGITADSPDLLLSISLPVRF